ncbi:MAG: DUF3592 domain-containing protein [Clostridia bacterium]|nr:DUF3592 domain-containing protein [Clostridia bacterium]
MEKLRYNRTFKRGIIVVLILFLLFGSILTYSIVGKIQYDSLISNMKTVEATIVDIDLDVRVRAPDVQIIYVSYKVDGTAFSRELETDTTFSFAAGVGAHYSVGDKVDIFYDPQNPEVIAFSRSVGVGYFYMGVSLIGLALGLFVLIYMLKHPREYLVTQDEYDKEKEALKRSKAARKKRKKARKKQKRKKNAKVRRIIKIVLIVLASLVGAFVLFLLLGALLMAFGY